MALRRQPPRVQNMTDRSQSAPTPRTLIDYDLERISLALVEAVDQEFACNEKVQMAHLALRTLKSPGLSAQRAEGAAPSPMRDAVIALLNAIQMEQHNEDIFKGKWKKGAKAWSGEFVAKMRKEAIEKGNAALAADK